MAFPEHFTWGAATSAYQIEGAADTDGRGPSVWDTFCHRDGTIWGGHHGDVTCDHYHRVEPDVALMQEIGLQAYRFSLSWTRLLPDGIGTSNPAGIAFYDRLIDALLAANITPYVTLFHWDFPETLHQQGGWLNRDSAEWFTEFAALAARSFSDRVENWITLNEPSVYISHGHISGTHAPGNKLSVAQALQAGHHTLLAHGRAVCALRETAERPLRIGMAPVGSVSVPASDSEADVSAARRATCSVTAKNMWNNTWWMDPVLLGHYPADGLALFGDDAPEIQAGDMKGIHQPIDFLGLNIYSGSRVRANEQGDPETVPFPTGVPMTRFNWPLLPEALHWGPKFLWERYQAPIVITENGMSGTDWVSLDGQVHDPQRIDYLHRYLRCLDQAIREGVPVEGYFLWSVLDNFEWAEGYKERFGIIYVDFETGERIPKDSAHWYRDVIVSRGADL